MTNSVYATTKKAKKKSTNDGDFKDYDFSSDDNVSPDTIPNRKIKNA